MPIHIVIKMATLKDKKIILKEVRKIQDVTYKGTPIGYQLTFQQKCCNPEGSGRIHLK